MQPPRLYPDHTHQLATALRYHEASQLAEAEPVYRNILADVPEQVDALHLLGTLCGQTGREKEGINLISQAIELRPGVAAMHNNLGNVLRQMGRLSDAIAAHRTAVDLDRSHARAWNNLGNALRDDGQLEAAIAAYRKSLKLRSDLAEVHSNLGIALRAQGRLDEAISSHRRAIALAPNSSEAFNNLGVALRDQGRMHEALAAHERAVALRPHSLSAISNLGAAQRRAGEVDLAIETLGRALAIDPDFADAHNNLGSALIDRGDFASAASSCRRAIELRSGYADAHGNLAIALAYLGDVDQAMREARLAVRFMPEQPLAHWNLSMLLLLVGDFETGWPEHEWRWKCPSMTKDRQFDQPRWNGEPLIGKTVLLYREQGFGDMLQFVRYAPLVAQFGGEVIVECQPELLRLFREMPGIAQCVRAGTTPPKFDLQCPLMSLPFAVRGRKFVPPPIPYLSAPEDDSDSLRWQIDAGGFNVGLAWAGDPAHQNDRARSMALGQLAPIAVFGGVTFHSLQKGPAAVEAKKPPAGMCLIDHSTDLTDFAATASLIEHLDLVITVDTAVAHLAGAMGKPTYVMLPFMPDWRWMLHRADSPWYPTIKLFRQPRANEWDFVIAAIVESLRLHLRLGATCS
jgi:tetratricopeptide (TPR) repeat protein